MTCPFMSSALQTSPSSPRPEENALLCFQASFLSPQHSMTMGSFLYSCLLHRILNSTWERLMSAFTAAAEPAPGPVPAYKWCFINIHWLCFRCNVHSSNFKASKTPFKLESLLLLTPPRTETHHLRPFSAKFDPVLQNVWNNVVPVVLILVPQTHWV